MNRIFSLLLLLPLMSLCTACSSHSKSEAPSPEDQYKWLDYALYGDRASLNEKSIPGRSSGPDASAQVSPKQPWGDFVLQAEDDDETPTPWWAKVLLWAPNRVLDAVDMIRVDVGAGFSFGAVLRLTKYGQVGYRSVSPVSVRVGAFGRKLPVVLERSSEFGIGPAFLESHDRDVCKGEIGFGADLFLVGGYGGVCIEEVLDFVAGIFFLDVMGDDLR